MDILIFVHICIYLGIVLSQRTTGGQEFCKKTRKGNIYWDLRITETYLQFVSPSLIESAKQCLRRKRCKSFNFSRALTLCELNYIQNGTPFPTEHSHVFIHSNISDWDKDLIGSCQNHSCAINEKCNEHGKCEISDCGPARVIPKNAYVINTGHHEVGNGLFYGCEDGYFLYNFEEKANIEENTIVVKCNENGQWDNFSFKCEEMLMDEGHWYYFSSKKKNWWDAQAVCRGMKYNLVKIDKEKEFMWINHELNKQDNGNVWIGGNDIEKEGRWVWEADKSNITFTKWYKDQPDHGKDEDCIRMREDGKGWRDIKCSDKERFICEQMTL